MNKKLIIQIVVIVIAFGGAGFVLYNGLFKGATTPQSAVSPLSAAATQQTILPYGATMDFNKVLYDNQRNLQYNLITFPVLDPKTEVGIDANSLIVPLPQTAQPGKK